MTEHSAEKIAELRALVKRSGLYGLAWAATLNEMLDDFEEQAFRLEAAEARAEKAEAWMLEHRNTPWMGRWVCMECHSPDEAKAIHEPGCYVAELEGRRAKETPKIDLPNGVLPTLETGR